MLSCKYPLFLSAAALAAGLLNSTADAAALTENEVKGFKLTKTICSDTFEEASHNGLSILFIISKNQLLVLLIFAMVSFVSFAFISALIFKISLLLLTLGFFISSFSSYFRCRLRLFI